jgi:alanine racemase
MSGPGSASSQLRVHLGIYRDNLIALRSRLPEQCGLMPIVKANGYGLGAAPIARLAVTEGARMLGVATVAEGIELREAGIEAPILVLVQAPEQDFEAAVRHKLRLSVSDFAAAEKLGDEARKARSVVNVHCEIDTGMGRQGFLLPNAATQLRNLTRISHVDIEGIYTHFATAEKPEDGFADQQLRAFRQLIRELESEGVPYEMAHAANSAATLFVPASAFDLVRPGLITYGVWPGGVRPPDCPFRPVATWTSRISLLRNLPDGASISYGRTYFTSKATRIAAIPVGYSDGYPFALSNKGEMLVRGRRCPVRGRVTMNETLIDVSDVRDAAVGDKVTLLGSDGAESVTVEGLAALAGLPPHAILTGIGGRVDRVYAT